MREVPGFKPGIESIIFFQFFFFSICYYSREKIDRALVALLLEDDER